MKKSEMINLLMNDAIYYIDEGIRWNSPDYKERYEYAKQIGNEMFHRGLGIASTLYTLRLQTNEENDRFKSELIDKYCMRSY